MDPLKATLSRSPLKRCPWISSLPFHPENLGDLKADVDAAFEAGANHVALYPFIDFTFTDSVLPSMGKKEKRRLLDQITRYCLETGCTRSSIWTFAKEACFLLLHDQG